MEFVTTLQAGAHHLLVFTRISAAFGIKKFITPPSNKGRGRQKTLILLVFTENNHETRC